jgi:hypothetical protein
MHMPPNNGGAEFTPPPAGTHIATCYRVIDLGTQKQEWQGQAKEMRKVLLSWELPEETMEDGKPFTVSKRYTLSSHEKSTLRKDLEAWRGKSFTDADFGPGGFDIASIIGKACLLSIVHTEKEGKTYANIASLSRLTKGMTPPEIINERAYLSLEPGKFVSAIMDKLSNGLQETIRKSPEYAAMLRGRDEPQHYEHSTSDLPEDEIPF